MITGSGMSSSATHSGKVFTHAIRLALYAMLALSCGAAIYLLDREITVALVPDSLADLTLAVPLFGNLGYQLPSFFHVYAFILLTALCLPRGRNHLFTVCATWLAIECLFEFGQYPGLQGAIAEWIFSHSGDLALLKMSGHYFLNGTFDTRDLLAAALGAVAAWLTIYGSSRERRQNDEAHLE